jgi:hypothetical protein
MLAEVISIGPVYQHSTARSGDRVELAPELGLTVVAAVRGIRRVAAITYLVRVDDKSGNAELLGDSAGHSPLRVRVRRATTGDGQDAIGTKCVDRDAREIS